MQQRRTESPSDTYPQAIIQDSPATPRRAIIPEPQHADGPFVGGSRLTIADLSLYVLIAGLRDGTYCAGVTLHQGALASLPRLSALVAAVAALPRVRAAETFNATVLAKGEHASRHVIDPKSYAKSN